MDKEDALICFEEVIKEYEKSDSEKQERKQVLEKRVFRKNRERFVVRTSGLLYILPVCCTYCLCTKPILSNTIQLQVLSLDNE